LMNNSIGEIELIPGGSGSLVPGERMMSNMAPTTARSGSEVISIGSPGADRITSALAITLVRFLCSGDTLFDSIEHPRLHPESLSPLQVAAEVGLEIDHAGVRWYPERHMFFGGVNAAGMIGGELVAHADSRRVGSPVVVSSRLVI
jgi:gamma-glutamyltranspeptidase / glutathione hydrolase